VPEPTPQQTPPSGWESPDATSSRSPEELLVQLIVLFRQLLAVAQALLELLEQRLGHPRAPRTQHHEVHDIQIT
jgi:hypothetical protein